MPRFALGIEYDGSNYAGWQQQRHAKSIQQAVERALARVADHAVQAVAAGRTDAGVHALEMTAHFDSDAVRPLHAWVLGANAGLPADITALWVHPVPDGFSARHDAHARRYLYRILDRHVRPALEPRRVCWVRRPLDAAAMHEAAQALVGHHDFTAFRAAACQSSTPIRRLSQIEVQRNAGYVDIHVRANAFLHHMVRNIAGSLIHVGLGERTADWLGEVLSGRDRTRAGPTAPPQGLYFAGAEYADEYGLPSYKLQRPPPAP